MVVRGSKDLVTSHTSMYGITTLYPWYQYHDVIWVIPLMTMVSDPMDPRIPWSEDPRIPGSQGSHDPGCPHIGANPVYPVYYVTWIRRS